MTDRANVAAAERLEELAVSGDWTGFYAVVKSEGSRMSPDVTTLNAAYRVARASKRSHPVPGFRDLKVAMLRNATLEPWLPFVFAAFVDRGLIPHFWLGDYGVYEQYLAGSSPGWREASPDLTLIYFDPEELVGDGALLGGEDVATAVERRMDGLLAAIDQAGVGRVVVSTLTPPTHGFRQVYDSQLTSGWTTVRRRLNASLVEKLGGHSNVFVLDLDALATSFGGSRARDLRTYHAAHVPFSPDFMHVAARGLAAVAAPLFTPPRKCVVVDGDNVLWGGILGEDGPQGVQLGAEYPGSLYRRFQLYLKALADQGILLALNSKNNQDDVLGFLGSRSDHVLRETDFAARRINWEDKATNLREIAAELNIGLDAIVFVDDSEVECELIRRMMPEVLVCPFPQDPLEIPGFIESFPGVEVLRVTDEDRKRAATIRANSERERLRTEAGDLDAFIRSLEIRLDLHCQPADRIPRIAQLTQRTNQFNLTTRRYGEDEIRSLMEEGLVYTLSMADRFSDYGTVGVAIVRTEGEVADLDTLLLSCRAFGRDVERAFLERILQDLARRDFQVVYATYAPTPKNAMVADFYVDCGFVEDGAVDGSRRFHRDLATLEPTGLASRYEIVTHGFR